MNVLVTGGCGFIGSNLVLHLRRVRPSWKVVTYDALTYAGNRENLSSLNGDSGHQFIHADVRDAEAVRRAIRDHGITAILHLAAETHVDRSITDPSPFIQSNVAGTQVLLDAAVEAKLTRVVLVSTDEVYGSLGPTGTFTETSPLNPSSPYSASKAAADLLAIAYHRTFGLDVVVTRSTNNYGPYQFPEKLIPLMLLNALADQPLPVYGNGLNVRDWIHVEDHCAGLLSALERGKPGETYNLGGGTELPNLELVRRILGLLGKPESLITFVADRPGHDFRYAMDSTKARRELGWGPSKPIDQGLSDTLAWYRQHVGWWQRVQGGQYRSSPKTQHRPVS